MTNSQSKAPFSENYSEVVGPQWTQRGNSSLTEMMKQRDRRTATAGIVTNDHGMLSHLQVPPIELEQTVEVVQFHDYTEGHRSTDSRRAIVDRRHDGVLEV